MKFPHENWHVGHVFRHGQLTLVGPHDKAGKTHRAARFAAWLLKTYGEEAEHEKRDSGHMWTCICPDIGDWPNDI